MSMQRILALTDLSPNSLPGLDLADSVARRLHARVVVGYAHTRSDILRDYAARKEDAARLAEWVKHEDESHLRNLCETHVDALRLGGCEIVEADNGRDGVMEIIRRTKPDLVCMATHGRSGVKHLLLGSIAEHTLRTAEVPVLVTKGAAFPQPEEPLRVLAALDLIDAPTYLPGRVASMLAPEDELILAHVVESIYYSPAPYGSEFSLPQPDVPRLAEAARMKLEEVKVRGPRVSVDVATGRPGPALVELEKKHQPHIVAARTHGRRGFDRLMLGSVSEFLARRCAASVLVFPKLG